MNKIILLPEPIWFFLLFVSACTGGNRSSDGLEKSLLEQLEQPKLEYPSADTASMWSPQQREANASLYFLLAEYSSLFGDKSKAKDLFSAAYNLDANAFIGSKLLRSRAAVGDRSGILEEAQKMVLLYPKSIELRMLYCELLSKFGQFDKAIEQSKYVLSQESKNEKAYIQYISALRKQNKNKQALILNKKMTQEMPASVSAWSLLSLAYTELKKYTLAEKAAQKAFLLQGGRMEGILSYAYALEKAGKIKEAFRYYNRFFSLIPKQDKIKYRIYLIVRTFGSIDEAVNKLESLKSSGKIRKKISLDAHAIYLLWEAKRYNDATTLLKLLVDAKPSSNQMRFLYAQGFEKKGNLQQAVIEYEKIAEESEFFVISRYRLAQIKKVQKKSQEALGIILKLIPHKYSTWRSYVFGAQLYSEAKEYEKAVDILAQGVKKHPSKVRLLFLKGVYEERVGRVDDCINSMISVLKQDPFYSGAYNYLGYLYAERGVRLEEAEKLILVALSLKPNDGYYLDSLGWVYFKQEKYQQALELFLKAITLAPQEGVILEHIAEVYLKLKKMTEAKRYFEKALRGKIEDKDKARIKQRIADEFS